MISFSQGGFPSRRNHYLGTASGAATICAVPDFGTHAPSRPPWDLGWGLGFGVWGLSPCSGLWKYMERGPGVLDTPQRVISM